MESILGTVKSLLNVHDDDPAFDQDIMVGINAALFTLMQLGIGPEEGFSVTSGYETWSDFLGDRTDLHAVQQYVALKTKLVFDPPSYGFVTNAIQDTIKELEWRLCEEEGYRGTKPVFSALWSSGDEVGCT